MSITVEITKGNGWSNHVVRLTSGQETTELTVPMPKYAADFDTTWGRLGDALGKQPAAYQKAKFNHEPEQNKITCQQCKKQCTKARGGFVLTRSTVVCGKCYDERKHGPSSSQDNHGPVCDPATCQHARRDTKGPNGAAWDAPRAWYCLDCWADLPGGRSAA